MLPVSTTTISEGGDKRSASLFAQNAADDSCRTDVVVVVVVCPSYEYSSS